MTADSAATIEAIDAKIVTARPPHGDEWDLRTIVDGRIHVSRTATDSPVVFIEGDEGSFGNYSRLPGARHVRARDIDTGREFDSLQIVAPTESLGGGHALAHIVYEMASLLTNNRNATNEELLLGVRWVLNLLGTQREVLSQRAQLGLAGECRLLRELLNLASGNGVAPAVVVERWVDGARDFAARGISVEVKTTSQNSRLHHIDSISQLEPAAAGEIIYLYSLGIKTEELHDRKLTTYIDDVVALLLTADGEPDEQARSRFFAKLEARGYYNEHRALYEVGPGLMLNGMLPARLFRAGDLDYLRVASFKDNTMPSMVRNVGYDLEVPDGEALNDERSVFLELITSDPI
jgi:hypothetical protein